MLVEQAAKPQHGGGIGHRLTTQVNTDEAAQAGTVVQGLFARQIGQVEPVLQEVDAQHALKANGRAAVACFGVVRLYHLAQSGPWHYCLHGPQELFASGGFARMLESVVLICGHCQGLLLHLRITFDPSQWWTLISVALSLALGWRTRPKLLPENL